MMFKTAVQKDRLPFQCEGAATSFGEGLAPKPKPSYVPAYIHYDSNMGGRHRWLLLFRQPITNMYKFEAYVYM